jgi:hypothetical protein
MIHDEEIVMTRDAITAQIKSELEHIPPGGPQQSMLRMIYNKNRYRNLSKGSAGIKHPREILKDSIEEVKAAAAAPLEYDVKFFEDEPMPFTEPVQPASVAPKDETRRGHWAERLSIQYDRNLLCHRCQRMGKAVCEECRGIVENQAGRGA